MRIPLAGLAVAGLTVAAALSLNAQPTPPPPPVEIREVQVEIFGGGGYLGVGVADINAERAKALKLKEERGVEITRVERDSPAEKAGLKVGDVVLEYQGQRVESVQQFARMVRETPEGRQVKLLISRDGNTQTLTATIGARRGPLAWSREDQERFRDEMARVQRRLGEIRIQIPDIPQVFMAIRSSGLGIEAESLNPQLAEFFGVKEGVLVRMVLRDTPAERAGLKAGDVITKVDGTAVREPQDITRKLRSIREKKTLDLTIVRNHKEMTVPVTVEPYRPAAERWWRGPRLVSTEERL